MGALKPECHCEQWWSQRLKTQKLRLRKARAAVTPVLITLSTRQLVQRNQSPGLKRTKWRRRLLVVGRVNTLWCRTDTNGAHMNVFLTIKMSSIAIFARSAVAMMGGRLPWSSHQE